MTSFHDAPDKWMEDDEAMEERSSVYASNQSIFSEKFQIFQKLSWKN